MRESRPKAGAIVAAGLVALAFTAIADAQGLLLDQEVSCDGGATYEETCGTFDGNALVRAALTNTGSQQLTNCTLSNSPLQIPTQPSPIDLGVGETVFTFGALSGITDQYTTDPSAQCDGGVSADDAPNVINIGGVTLDQQVSCDGGATYQENCTTSDGTALVRATITNASGSTLSNCVVTNSPTDIPLSPPFPDIPSPGTASASGTVSGITEPRVTTASVTCIGSLGTTFGDTDDPNTIDVAVDQPPDCSGVVADPATILRADREQFVLVTLSGATDPEGGAVSYQIDGVAQDEPVSGIGIGDDTAPDALAGPSSDTILLRAERNPKSDGRFYRIAFTVTDIAGGTCSASFATTTAKVVVPRRAGITATDDFDAGAFDSSSGLPLP